MEATSDIIITIDWDAKHQFKQTNKLHQVVNCKNDKIFENYSRKGKQLVNDVESSPVSQSTTDASFKSPSSPAPKATPKRKGAKATATLSKYVLVVFLFIV